jgi:hypothetical protein
MLSSITLDVRGGTAHAPASMHVAIRSRASRTRSAIAR